MSEIPHSQPTEKTPSGAEKEKTFDEMLKSAIIMLERKKKIIETKLAEEEEAKKNSSDQYSRYRERTVENSSDQYSRYRERTVDCILKAVNILKDLPNKPEAEKIYKTKIKPMYDLFMNDYFTPGIKILNKKLDPNDNGSMTRKEYEEYIRKNLNQNNYNKVKLEFIDGVYIDKLKNEITLTDQNANTDKYDSVYLFIKVEK